MSRFATRFAPVLALGLVALVAAQEAGRPTTATRPVTDVYHGAKVVDPYRWLEKAGDPEVKRWVEAQNKHTRAALDALPGRARVLQRVQTVNDRARPEYTEVLWQGGRLFAKYGGRLVTLKAADDLPSKRVLVDPFAVAPGKDPYLEFYVPSLDGKRVAVCIDTEGRQEGTLHVYDVEAGKKLDDVLPLVSTGTLAGSVAWNADGSGFWYTRHLTNGDANPRQQIWFHQVGTPVEKDTYALGKEFDPLASTGLVTSDDGRFTLCTVALGWLSDQTEHYLRLPSGEWKRVCAGADRVLSATFGPDSSLYLLSFDQAPRGQVLRLPPGRTDLKETKRIVPQPDGLLYTFLPTTTRLYLVEWLDGSARLRVLDPDGKQLKALPVPSLCGVEELVALEKDALLYRVDSYVASPAWHRYDPAVEESKRTPLSTQRPGGWGQYEVVREYAKSKDGTRVPLTVVRRKGLKLDGTNPTWLTGYGGYNLVVTPSFDVNRQVWLERGGVFAMAHLRGDGDLGEDWARAGMLTKRQNAFDDFAACLDRLVELKYTRPEKLAVEGGSNGGLLVGAALTQYPEKFRAAVSWVGKYDVLRSEAHATGLTDVTELGSVKNAEQFRAMHSYSPYHRVQEGKAYPAVLLVTGTNDTRCNPADTWKMAARLQAATASKLPVLLWTEEGAGHDVRSEELDADMFAFLFHHLGVEDKDK